MPRTAALLTVVLLSLVLVAFAACDGGGEEEGTGTPPRPTATSATQTPTPTGGGASETAAPTTSGATQTPGTTAVATVTEAAVVTPTAPSFSGGATATVTVGDQTFTFENGKCDVAPDETWLAVNIGQAGGEYFGLLVGSNEAAPAGARPISGGGLFTDGEIALTVEHAGGSFLMGGTSAAAQSNTVTLAADLKSGEFEGSTLFDAQPISGSFRC
jgi:hypothetical protein